MKRTIIKVCLSWLLVCPLLTFTSCKDWLDVEMSDNIMEKNSFNPFFIKSELLNF